MARHETAAPPEMNAQERLTFLDLVATVEEFAENDAEVLATLRHMFENGHVRFDRGSIDALPRAA
jgi:hypothetical protein